jgi:hypothetical protein
LDEINECKKMFTKEVLNYSIDMSH